MSDDIADMNEIKAILSSIQKKQLFCSIVLQFDYRIDYHEKVRILEISDDYFFYRTFKEGATVKDRASFNELVELKVELLIKKALESKEKDTRWYLLDFDTEGVKHDEKNNHQL